MTETKKLLESLKDKIDQISLEEKMNFCKELESFGESWRSLIFSGKLEERKEIEKNDLELERLKVNIK